MLSLTAAQELRQGLKQFLARLHPDRFNEPIEKQVNENAFKAYSMLVPFLCDNIDSTFEQCNKQVIFHVLRRHEHYPGFSNQIVQEGVLWQQCALSVMQAYGWAGISCDTRITRALVSNLLCSNQYIIRGDSFATIYESLERRKLNFNKIDP